MNIARRAVFKSLDAAPRLAVCFERIWIAAFMDQQESYVVARVLSNELGRSKWTKYRGDRGANLKPSVLTARQTIRRVAGPVRAGV